MYVFVLILMRTHLKKTLQGIANKTEITRFLFDCLLSTPFVSLIFIYDHKLH